MQDRYLYISEPDYAVLHTLTRHHALSDELDRAIVVPSEKMPPDIVGLNSRVTYVDESNGVSRTIELVLPEEDIGAGSGRHGATGAQSRTKH